MATYEIEAPNGKKYRVEGESRAGAVAALKKMLGLPIGPTKEAAGLDRPVGEGTVFERPNALADGGPGDTLRENPSDPLTRATGALGSFTDTMMLGGADEALAGIRALAGGDYSRELERLEQARRDYDALNTTGGDVATVAGIVGNPLNLIGGELLTLPRTIAGRTGAAAGMGGGIGGISGILGTEGDTGDRLVGGAVGAGAGAAMGGVAQPGLELLGFGVRKGAEGARGLVNTVRNQAQAKADPQIQADKLILRALLDDNMQLPILPERVQGAMPGQGFVNLGGENLTSLGRQATVAQGPGRRIASEFFEEQAAGAPDRAADSLKKLSDKGYYGTLEALDKSRSAAADPLYEAARQKGAAGVWNDHLKGLIGRPSMATAWRNAKSIAADRGDPLPEIFTMDAAGNITGIRQVPDLKTWDYIKKGLDDVIGGHKNQTTGKIETDAGRGVVALKRELLEELDALIPEYAAARQAYAGPSHSIEMVDKGRDYWRAKGDPADAIREFNNLPAGDKEYVRIGIVRDAIKDIGNTSDAGSVYVKLFNTPNKRALLETVFPDRATFEKFAAQMQAEKKMLATNRTVQGGSPTSRIDADKAAMSDLENDLGIVDALRTGSITRLLGEALQRGKNMQQGVSPQVAERLAQTLFSASPETMTAAINRLQGLRAPAPLAALRPGLLSFRQTPAAPFLGLMGGQGGQAIATPKR